ncbi:sentrin-specific protease 1-like [Branchiostoma lanceolatum]|uniref:sentrin-specific protease 1-like n=1 Tax=Branchiostoma lanceolatum TaxID=7740 RepID=UPI00345599BA
MNMIMDRSKLPGKLKVHAFNSFFYTRLEKKGPSAVMHWTGFDELSDIDLFLFPIHLGMHWCMAVVDFRSKSIRYYDSLGGRNDSCIENIRKYLQALQADERYRALTKDTSDVVVSDWTADYPQNTPRQVNGYDCGVFACQCAEFASRDAEMTFKQADVQCIRKQMEDEIRQGRLENQGSFYIRPDTDLTECAFVDIK